MLVIFNKVKFDVLTASPLFCFCFFYFRFLEGIIIAKNEKDGKMLSTLHLKRHFLNRLLQVSFRCFAVYVSLLLLIYFRMFTRVLFVYKIRINMLLFLPTLHQKLDFLNRIFIIYFHYTLVSCRYCVIFVPKTIFLLVSLPRYVFRYWVKLNASFANSYLLEFK